MTSVKAVRGIVLAWAVCAWPSWVRAESIDWLVLAPRAYELAPLLERWGQPKADYHRGIPTYRHQHGEQRAVAAVIGTGIANAVGSTALLLAEHDPELVVVMGTAGALDTSIRPLSVVIPGRITHADLGTQYEDRFESWSPRDPRDEQRLPYWFETDRNARAEAEGIAASITDRVLHNARLISGNAFISSEPHRDELRRRYGAAAIEMESSGIALLCHRLDIPLLVVRVVTDACGPDSVAEYLANQQPAAALAAAVVDRFIRSTESLDPLAPLTQHALPESSP